MQLLILYLLLMRLTPLLDPALHQAEHDWCVTLLKCDRAAGWWERSAPRTSGWHVVAVVQHGRPRRTTRRFPLANARRSGQRRLGARSTTGCWRRHAPRRPWWKLRSHLLLRPRRDRRAARRREMQRAINIIERHRLAPHRLATGWLALLLGRLLHSRRGRRAVLELQRTVDLAKRHRRSSSRLAGGLK